jgi:hypothetical protein
MRSQKQILVYLGTVGILLAFSLPRAARGREAHWIEGETYVNSTFNRHGWYQNTNIVKSLLSPGMPGVSDGNWHTHYTSAGSNEQVTALYRVTIAEGGTYTWWIRVNPFRNSNGGAGYSYRHRPPQGSWTAWTDLDTSEARDGMIDLVEPGIDIRFIGWCFGGRFELAPGTHEFEVRLARRAGD